MADALQALMRAQEEANKANEARYQQAMGIYDEMLSRISPESPFYKRMLAQGAGAGKAALIESGLGGTTAMAGVESAARLRLEDIMEQRRSEAMREKARFIERRQDVGPGYGTLASLAQAYGRAQAPQQRTFTRVYGPTHGASSFKGSGLLYKTRI